MSEKNLKDFIKYYKNNREKYQKEYDNCKEEFNKIINEWPISRWKQLSMMDYYRNDGRDTFSYCFQTKLKSIWAHAVPHIDIWDRIYGYKVVNDNKYQMAVGKSYNNTYYKDFEKEIVEKEWKKSRENVYNFLLLIKNNNIKDAIEIVKKEKYIHENIFHLLMYIYFPNKYLCILTKNRFDTLTDELKIKIEGTISITEKIIKLNEIIMEEFEKEGLKNENGYVISVTLWDYCPSKENKKNTENNEISKVDQKENKYCFISKEELEEIKEILEYKKNIILEGVPGVGKTYIAKKIALDIVGEENKKNIEIIQFHQSYSYEDFIEGLRPKKDSTFETVDGKLKIIVNDAKQNRNKKYVLIIDEINRGNISKIFGEAFMLIENDKRSNDEQEDYFAKLPYSKERFSIPDNIYFIGTMNTIDKSITLFDFALRRRFSMYEIEPCYNSENEEVKKEINRYLTDMNSEKLKRIWNIIKEINNTNEIGDLLIGHSYLCTLKKEDDIDKKIDMIVKYELLPQIKEYYLGDNNKYENIKDILMNKSNIENKEETINNEK